MKFLSLSSASLINFVKKGLEKNGGDYSNISDRMAQIDDFFNKLEDERLRSKFGELRSAYKDLFVRTLKIDKFKVSEDGSSATYSKTYTQYSSLLDSEIKKQSKHGVTICGAGNPISPMLYFGERRKGAEFTKKDTGLYFTEEKVVYHNEGGVHYEEFCLYAKGEHAEFSFDESNNLKSVTLATMSEPRLKIWGEPVTYNVENATPSLCEQNEVYFENFENEME